MTLLFILLGILASLNSAVAAPQFSVLAVPVQKRIEPRLFREKALLKRSHFISQVREVFGVNEAAALAKFGDASLGESLVLEFSSGKRLANFESWFQRKIHAYKLEKNPKVRATSTSLSPLQWGLHNKGEAFTVQVDDFTSKQMPAVAGEDVDLAGAPPMQKTVVVAVLDSGVDINHPDLKGAILRREEECKALEEYQACVAKQGAAKCESQFQIDHDGNGYPLDCNGWNFAAEDDGHGRSSSKPLPKTAGILGNTHVADYIGHGTHVAGIIAAQANGLGTEGVAPEARILPVRVMSGEPSEKIRAQEVGALPAPEEKNLNISYGLGDIVARGLLYAVRSGAQVVNMSLGWPDPLDSDLLRRIIAVARGQGVLLVAAAGNDSTDTVILPCRYDGVICVGAHGPDGALTFFSNYGYEVDLLAPGWNILSTFPTGLLPRKFTDQNGYEAKDGTSMAAPFVSGLLARLLGTGMPADEAYARLILGTRPSQASQVENPTLFANSSWSGNADLANSFKVSPQALILPSRKSAVRVEWDRVSTTVPFQFFLIDHWIDANNATVTVEALSSDVSLAKTSWTLDSWKALEEKPFATNLNILTPRVNSEIDFRVQVTANNSAPREFTLRAEIVSLVGPDATPGRDLKVLPLLDQNSQSLSQQYDEIHTISVDQGPACREYLGVRSNANARVLDLLREEDLAGVKTIRREGSATLPANGNQVDSLRKVLDPKTGDALYALIEDLPAPKGAPGQAPESQISWFDGAMKPRSEPMKVDSKVTYLSEDFQWQLRNGELVATWFGVGHIPPLEQKPYNPWDPTAQDESDFRMFFLASDGIHSVKLPKEYPFLVSLTSQTPEQKATGVVSALLAHGDDYALDYATAELVEGAWRNIRPLALATYHNLRGLIANPAYSLDPAVPFVGSVFSGFVSSSSGPKGSRRSTWIGPSASADFTAYPLRNFDAMADISATYIGAKRQAEFTLTKYDIQFHDFTHGTTLSTTQKRFSFLPGIFSIKTFFPTLVEDADLAALDGEKRVPALFVPGDFLYSRDTQVILPAFDGSGQATKLVRPAKFHLESTGSCTALPTPKAPDGDGPAEFVFFCGDRFLSVPLRY